MRPGRDIVAGPHGVEAPPWAPGHVGHTPQALVSAIVDWRLAGVLTSATALAMPTEYAMHEFGRVQLPERPSQLATLLQLEDHRRRRRPNLQPGPDAFREAIVGPPGRF